MQDEYSERGVAELDESWPRCECGARAPSAELLRMHKLRTGCPSPQARPLLCQRQASSRAAWNERVAA